MSIQGSGARSSKGEDPAAALAPTSWLWECHASGLPVAEQALGMGSPSLHSSPRVSSRPCCLVLLLPSHSLPMLVVPLGGDGAGAEGTRSSCKS